MADRELIRQCQLGNEAAFKQLVKGYYQRAYSMALYWTRNREAALDISQEAFIRIYRNIGKFDRNRSFSAWLFTIVKNLCKNYLQRKRRRWLVFSDLFPQNQHREDELFQYTSEEVEKNERRTMLWKALNKLPEADREIILLKDFQDFSYQEISQVLNIPLGTVMSRLYYARKKLLKILEDNQ